MERAQSLLNLYLSENISDLSECGALKYDTTSSSVIQGAVVLQIWSKLISYMG